MAIEQITIKRGHDWDDTPIDAQRYGAFAIHTPDGAPARYWKERSYFTVTHVATGMKLGDWSREHARTIARRLNRALPQATLTSRTLGLSPI